MFFILFCLVLYSFHSNSFIFVNFLSISFLFFPLLFTCFSFIFLPHSNLSSSSFFCYYFLSILFCTVLLFLSSIFSFLFFLLFFLLFSLVVLFAFIFYFINFFSFIFFLITHLFFVLLLIFLVLFFMIIYSRWGGNTLQPIPGCHYQSFLRARRVNRFVERDTDSVITRKNVIGGQTGKLRSHFINAGGFGNV